MFSHLDHKGNAQIVDISNKNVSNRIAVAYGKIYISEEIINQINKKNNKKGDIFTVAKIAGIIASKKTSEIIPLCHSLNLENIQIEFNLDKKNKFIEVFSTVKCAEKTGVEMEALTSVSVALLTIYDMCKAVDKKMIISDIHLKKKEGGKTNIKS